MYKLLKLGRQARGEDPAALWKSGGGGSSAPAQTTTTTVQQADPWAGQRPYLKQLFQEAQHLYEDVTPQYYPETTVARPSEATLAGREALTDYATRGAPRQIQKMSTAQDYALRGALDVRNNPYLRQAAEAAVHPVFQDLTNVALPAIRSEAIATGGYGGSRQQRSERQAVQAATKEAMDRTATMYSEAYQQGLDTFEKGLYFSPQVLQAGAVPATALDAVGQQQTAYQQALIEDEIARWNFQQALPYTELAQYQQLIGGGYGGEATSSALSTGDPYGRQRSSSGGFASVLGGAATGFAVGGPWGAAAGAILGLLS